eukprot:m.50503 g.50503  ORF g.50503 m.50503 type:complete len:70 (+) comp9015_c0_seq3:336-545(+)
MDGGASCPPPCYDRAESGKITIFFLTDGLALSPSSLAINADNEPWRSVGFAIVGLAVPRCTGGGAALAS